MKTYKTKDTFKSFYYRDNDLDSLLSEELPFIEEGKVGYND